MASTMTSAITLVLLLPATLPTSNAAVCAKAGENCIKKGCCSTPGTACYQKTKTYAGCLPVDSCKKGVHEPAPYNQPWSCVLLTWGCNDAYQPCEGGKGQSDDIVPCCQHGCVCNYTSTYYHQCVPPEGHNHCSKDGPQKRPKFADDGHDEEDGKKNDDDSDDDGGSDDEKKDDKDSQEQESDDLESDEADEETEEASATADSLDKNCFDMGNGKFVGPDCPESKVEIRSGGSAAVGAVSRLPWLAAGALAMAILVATATMVARRRQWRGAGHTMLQVDSEPSELDAEIS